MPRQSHQPPLPKPIPALMPNASPPATAPPMTPTPSPTRTSLRRRRLPNWSPYRHAANSGRSAGPTRTSSSPSESRASPMLSVETRSRVSRKRRSHSSIASHRSSSGERFHRSHFRQTTHNRPFAASNASRLPTGNDSTTSFVPRPALQKRHVAYTWERYCAAVHSYQSIVIRAQGKRARFAPVPCQVAVLGALFPARPSSRALSRALFPARSSSQPSSLVPNRPRRIPPCRPSRRQPARQHRDPEQTDGDRRERQRIGRFDAVEHALHEAREHHRSDETEHDPDDREREPAPDHQSQHVAALRAECEPHPDLALALAHEVGEHPVDA